MSQTQTCDLLFKLVIVGDEKVGKSCILTRYVDDTFLKTYVATVGIDFKIKTIQLSDLNIKLQIWDTEGRDRFRTLNSAYFRGAHGILLVYDVTNERSFENVCSRWVQEVDRFAVDTITKVIVGNKADLDKDRMIPYDRAKEEADQLGLTLFETSAFKGDNIPEIFMTLAEKIKQDQDAISLASGDGLDVSDQKGSKACNLL